MSALKPREPGVYFNLPAEDYHADPSLGSTDIKHLRRSVADYWWRSWMNPLQEESKDTDATLFGSALHKLVLEGREAFEEAYAVRPDKEDFEGLLDTAADLRAFLKDSGQIVSGTKPELIERARTVENHPPIWELLMEEFEAEAEGKIILAQRVYHEVLVGAQMVVKNPSLRKSFVGGIPEVSIFWVEGDVPCKARIDYLKPRAVVDLKSFSNSMGKPFDRAALHSIWNYGYHISCAHYLRGRAHFARFVRDGQVFGAADPDTIARIAAAKEWTFLFVFYASDGAPASKGYQMNIGTSAHEIAEAEIDHALMTYREALEKWGTDQWVIDEPIHKIDNEEVPLWLGMK